MSSGGSAELTECEVPAEHLEFPAHHEDRSIGDTPLSVHLNDLISVAEDLPRSASPLDGAQEGPYSQVAWEQLVGPVGHAKIIKNTTSLKDMLDANICKIDLVHLLILVSKEFWYKMLHKFF